MTTTESQNRSFQPRGQRLAKGRKPVPEAIGLWQRLSAYPCPDAAGANREFVLERALEGEYTPETAERVHEALNRDAQYHEIVKALREIFTGQNN